MLKVALEKNNEHVNEVSQLVNQPHNSYSQVNLLNDLRLDNEVSRILSQNMSPKRNLGSNKKHMISALNQESTDIATDENTARVSQKNVVETPDRQLYKTTSREVILNTNTILENSIQNDDLQIVQEKLSPDEEDTQPNAAFLEFINSLLENDVEDNDIITEIEKQVLLENKDFEDELDNLKHDIKQQDDELREIKKQKYCIVWPNPVIQDNTYSPDELIDKHYLQEEFLEISKDIRREVLKTKFVGGLPSVQSQMGRMQTQNNTLRRENNMQDILDLVMTNDDLLNKFYDIVFNIENKALRLPQVHSGDNDK